MSPAIDQSLSLLTDIAYGIIFAAAASHVARLFRQPLILGYVLGGVLLGTHLGFGLVTNEANIELISEIGLNLDRKSTRLNSSHVRISYAVFCLKKKKKKTICINQLLEVRL